MFDLIFGLFWLIFSLVFFVMWNFVPADSQSGATSAANVFIIFFIVIGVVITYRGFKKIIANWKTDRKGEVCYGLITDLKFNGTVINGVNQYDAYLKIFVESQGRFVEAHETIGDKTGQFPVGTYYAVKYYEDDINFAYPVRSFEGLPENARRAFDSQVIPEEMQYASNDNQYSYDNDPENEYDSNKYNYDYELKR